MWKNLRLRPFSFPFVSMLQVLTSLPFSAGLRVEVWGLWFREHSVRLEFGREWKEDQRGEPQGQRILWLYLWVWENVSQWSPEPSSPLRLRLTCEDLNGVPMGCKTPQQLWAQLPVLPVCPLQLSELVKNVMGQTATASKKDIQSATKVCRV